VLAEGHRALVFSQFTSYLKKAAAQLDARGIEYAYLDGSTRSRGEVIDKFKDGKAPVFLISLKAGGFGLNLTEATTASCSTRGGTPPPRRRRWTGRTGSARPRT
jgi:SNF2 family DNA or RNA helicase